MGVSTIEGWLSELGLPQYNALFEENGIDFDIFSSAMALSSFNR